MTDKIAQKINNNKYSKMLSYIVKEIKSTRVVIAQRINSTMMQMYWNIGKRLSEEQLEKGYGSGVVKRLSADLQQEFPDTTGFSPRNLWDMKRFYEFYEFADVKLRQLVAVLPWKHNLLIISSADGVAEYKLQFPEKEIKELINRELEEFAAEKLLQRKTKSQHKKG